MFNMDIKCKGITWVGNIYQKFEAMYLEVDDIICEETIKYVENQLQSVGANVKQFCSELMEDVLSPSSVDSAKGAIPDLSVEQNIFVAAYKSSKVGMDGDPKGRLCNVNHLLHPSSVEPVKGVRIDSSLVQNVDIGAYEKSLVGVKENSMKEKKFQSEMLQVVAPAEKDSSMASFFCGPHHEYYEKTWDSRAKRSPPTSGELTECNSSMKAGQISSNLVDATADISTALPSSNSIISVDTCEYKVLDIGLTPPVEDLSAESNAYVTVSVTESSWNGFEPYDKFSESEVFVSRAEIGSSDFYSAEGTGDNDVTEPGMEIIQPFDKVKLEESCMVDSNELFSVSPRASKHRSYKKKIEAFASKMRLAKKQEYEQQAIWYGDLDAGYNQQRGKSFTPSTFTEKSESLNHNFYEDDEDYRCFKLINGAMVPFVKCRDTLRKM